MDRETEIIEDQLSAGDMSLDEFNCALGDLVRDCRDLAREEAEDAYKDSLGGWY